MNTTSQELAAAGSAAGMVVIVVFGLLVTAALVGAVRLGIRVRHRESAPPRPAEQPTLPREGPVHEERNIREPNEVPRAAGEADRLTPYQLGNAPSRPNRNQTRPRWQPGSSGSFGSGGSGAT
ncbi:DUF6479 family protein [Streptomyces olivochromogenes]|uniref:DUF6479 family protein n=1 Tax=Streptomyces olivochromogenes TaxID=1963 RepID=UPI001F33FAC7|nr:DUF6479 family protein [Streptomyces olivochromogenes]MCF3134162.1 hypothetical protein [Streptomyces olivochromogenes]